MKEKLVIGFDTSNYTTSVAAVNEKGEVVAESRLLLKVKKGERGLRQSEALFQHVVNLPKLMPQIMKKIEKDAASKGIEYQICTVAVSTRPRPVDGSYMPVFLAGKEIGECLAAVMGLPVYEFSHQEGHIAAISGAHDMKREFLSFHLSGGTGEILRVKGCRPEKIIGGTRDLSFGQLIDRIGVHAGFDFPAGACMDKIACEHKQDVDISISSRGRLVVNGGILKHIHVVGSYADLSGAETQAIQALDSGVIIEQLAPELFYHISEALYRMVASASESEGLNEIFFAGGVSASAFIRQELKKRLTDKGIIVHFGKSELSSDNACGIARLGMEAFLRG